MGGPLFSRDDLDELSETATGSDDPSAVAAALVDAAAAGRLADPADTGYAYLLAAEIHERAEDLVGALALTERALTAYRRSGHDELSQPRGYRARLLLQLGREDEAMAELTELGADDPGTDDPGTDDAGAGAHDVEVREYVDPGGDGELEPEAVLLIWPQDAFEQIDQKWPEVLEPTGAESWDDYRRYCQAVITSWSKPGRGPLLQVTGDADEFEEWLAEQGADPYHENLVSLARAYGDHLAERGDPVELPPGRGDPCWCGSGLSYAGCCRPLSP